ncbi:MAG: YihY/virulence factor BrkB family protein [Lachnospiraceae bacterium]
MNKRQIRIEKGKMIISYILKFGDMLTDNYTAACAAQAAFFLLLSVVPMVSLLLAVASYLPFSTQDVTGLIMQIVPGNFRELVDRLLNEWYLSSGGAVISVSVIAMIWSASKGIYALMIGFNSMYQIREQNPPLKSRAVSVAYTVILIMIFAVVMSIYFYVSHYYKIYIHANFEVGTAARKLFLFIRYVFGWILFYVFILMMYVVLPGGFGLPKDDEEKVQFRKRVKSQMSGAAFCSIAWLVISQLLVIYIKYFPNFSVMYGSLAGIVIAMLWLYFCMYSLFIGAVINYLLSKGYLTEVKKMLK